jgi:antitoxin (DNA-binding transcriptional repressor) of toxin-antitoxin stability system
MVTRDGRGVAELRPLAPRPLPAATLLERWRRLPPVDAAKLRTELDAVLDGTW